MFKVYRVFISYIYIYIYIYIYNGVIITLSLLNIHHLI